MAQFDSLIIFPLIWSLLFVLILHYNTTITMLIPSFSGVKKFREKKGASPSFYEFYDTNVEVKLNRSY